MGPVKNYKPEQMARALEAVRRGEAVATAAKKYGVPRCTLRNKFIGKSPAVCSMGPPTVLSSTEEKLLVSWIIAMSERHCPVGKDQLLDSVQKIINVAQRSTPFTNNRPGKKWLKSFLDRHPELSLRVSQNLTKSRDGVSEQQIRAWFAELTKYFVEHNLADIFRDPKRIFNTDESAFFLNPKGDRVFVRRGEKNVYTRSGNEKENLTVLVTANAAGQLPPPMIVFSYERVPGYIANSVPEEWGIGRSESGWMCGSTFFEYMTNVFHPWLIASGIQLPIIFFLDGHASHLTLHLTEFCAQNQIELITLYPNSTHLLQPMDISVFRPLKVFYKKNINKWKSENLGHEVKKENFGPILKASLTEISTDCIKNGFRVGGLQPFGPDYVDFSKISRDNRTDINVEGSVSSTEDSIFLKKLESEVVSIYNAQKLNLFHECFYKHKEKLQEHLPDEDVSLYIIWAKYKHKCHIVGHVTATDGNSSSTHPDTITSDMIVNQSPHDRIDASTPEVTVQPPNYDSERVPSELEIHLNHNHDLENLTNCTPTKIASSSSSFANYMLNTSNVQVPSPFKKALFWPEPEKKKRRITKEKIPSVITSKAWREYSEKKQLEKKTKEDEKEKRKLEREEKTRLQKEKIKVKPKKKGANAKKEKQIPYKKRTLPKESSSDEAIDSDITYIETGESECSEMDVEYLEEEDTKETEIFESLPTNHNHICQSNNIKVLSEVAVNIILDDKLGKFIAVPVSQDLEGDTTKLSERRVDKVLINVEEQITKDSDKDKSVTPKEEEIEKEKEKKQEGKLQDTTEKVQEIQGNIEETKEITEEGKQQQITKKSGREDLKQVAEEKKDKEQTPDGEEIAVESDEDLTDDFLKSEGVLVRYYQRKQWKYFIGFIQNVMNKQLGTFYTVKFLKTVKKPQLKFVLPKRLDQDIVPLASIVKKIKLRQDSLPSEYHLCNENDQHYF